MHLLQQSFLSRSTYYDTTFYKVFTAIAVSCLVAACGYELKVVDTNSNAINPDDNPAFQQELKSYSMVSGGNVQTIPTLTAVGYAVVSTQPGKSDAQRRLMAIRAARMAAIRELAEQIHGLQVDSNTTVVDLMVQNDTFRGVVTGIIRGPGLFVLIRQGRILMRLFLK